MSISRRRFLGSAAVVSAALVLKPGTFVFGQNSPWSKTSSNTLSNTSSNPFRSYSREMFEPYVGDVFRVRAGKQVVDLKLVALEESQPVSPGITTGNIARTDCFSLRFEASRRLPATAKIHKLNHSQLGSFDLFMAHSEEGGKFLNTAVINQLV
jgi:hypothetical protein